MIRLFNLNSLFIPALCAVFFMPCVSVIAAPPVSETPGHPLCYTPDVYAAEQFIRFQSQLMVIGTVCSDYSKGKGIEDSYTTYTNFASKNKLLIRRYEQRLISAWTAEQVAEPEKNLNTLKTKISNTISQYAMSVSPQKFCPMFMTRLERSSQLSEPYIEKLVSRVTPGQESSRPLCPPKSNPTYIEKLIEQRNNNSEDSE